MKIINNTNYNTADLQRLSDIYLAVHSNTPLKVEYYRPSDVYKERHQRGVGLPPFVRFTDCSTKKEHKLLLVDVRKLPELVSPMEGMSVLSTALAPRDLVMSVALRMCTIKRNLAFRRRSNWDEWPTAKARNLMNEHWSEDFTIRFTPGRLDEDKVKQEAHVRSRLSVLADMKREVDRVSEEVRRKVSSLEYYRNLILSTEERLKEMTVQLGREEDELAKYKQQLIEEGILPEGQ